MCFFKNTGSGKNFDTQPIKDWLYKYSNITSDGEFEIAYNKHTGEYEINTFSMYFNITYNTGNALPYKFNNTNTFNIESNSLTSMVNFPNSIDNLSSFILPSVKNFIGFPKFVNNSLYLYEMVSIESFNISESIIINGTLHIQGVNKQIINPYLFDKNDLRIGKFDDYWGICCDSMKIMSNMKDDFFQQVVNDELNFKIFIKCDNIVLDIMNANFNIKIKQG